MVGNLFHYQEQDIAYFTLPESFGQQYLCTISFHFGMNEWFDSDICFRSIQA
ncbi:MAG: hypothetical protein J0H18_09540 [Rhizobiales bacterium]|nr:hypothetical protein [Hyphomicrobiales bacterium]